MQRARRVVLLMVMVLLGGQCARAEDFGPRELAVVIRDGQLTVSGNKVVDEVWPGLVLTVQNTNGEWLWVNNGKPGWLQSQYVVFIGSPVRKDRNEWSPEFSTTPNLNEMIKANPTAALYSARGGVRYRSHGFDLALADFSEAIRLDPHVKGYYYNRGNVWYEKEEHDKAITDFNEALRLDPKWAPAYHTRGLAWYRKKEFDKAIADHNEAIRLDPENTKYYIDRGDTWRTKGEYDKAIADYSEVIRRDPKNSLRKSLKRSSPVGSWAYFSFEDNNMVRGGLWAAKGEYDKALADFNEAIRVDPNFANAYFNRGTMWSYKQEYDNALADFNEAIRLEPRGTWFYINRGSVWLAKQEYGKANVDFYAALGLDDKNVQAAFSIGVIRFLIREPKTPDQFQKAIDFITSDTRPEYSEYNAQLMAYPVILGSLSAQLLGNADLAKKFLDDSAGKLKTDSWPYPVVQLLRGELDEPALLALATDNLKQTQARCYLGVQQLIAKNRDAAIVHFSWVRDQGNKMTAEYVIAVAELKRLESEK